MDKWLERDLEAFNELMCKKGYTGAFVVNNQYSGELLAAIKACASAAKEQEYDMFPLILHTVVRTDGPLSEPLLRLRCDESDQGIRIRDAIIETVKVNGTPKHNISVAFTNTEKFPTNVELMEKVKNKFMKKRKIKI